MFADPRMLELIETLWREYYGLYSEKYSRDPQKWLLNNISPYIEAAQALGQGNTLNGNKSLAQGEGQITRSLLEIILGAYALDDLTQDPTEWIPTDRLLTIGNGPDNDHRSTALIIFKNGILKLFQSIVIGPHPELEEGQTPVDGTVQYTAQYGPQYWQNNQWNNFGTGGGETHPPVTIATESAALASIDENQVLTINEQQTESHPAVTIATESAALASIDENQVLTINEYTSDFLFENTDDISFDIDVTAKIIRAYTNGISGTFIDNDLNTVTFRRGLIIDDLITRFTLTVNEGTIT